MRKIDEKIIQTLKKTGKGLDSISLNDCDAWKNTCAVLEKVIKDIPKKKMSGLNKLLCLCVEALQAISEKSATNPLFLVDAIFDGLTASQEYLLRNPDHEVLVNKADRALSNALNNDPGERKEQTTHQDDDSTTQQPNSQALDDVAMLLIQTEPDDIPGLASLHEALETIAADESYHAASREEIGKALNIVEEIIKRNVPDPDSAIIEVGNLIEKAMNAMEGTGRKKGKTNLETGVEAQDEELPVDSVPAQDGEVATDTTGEQEDEPTVNDSRTNYMPEDPDFDLIGEFITEGIDLITDAEEALLSLENDPDDKEAVGTVFRAFHTIKGTSAFMELSIISEMGHHAETLLSRVRDGEIGYTGGYADLALRSLDMLKELIESVEPALGGEPLYKPEGYDELLCLLENPENAGISEESGGADMPRIGDILVAQGKVDRESVEEAIDSPRLGDILVAEGKVDRDEVEESAAAHPDMPIGKAVVESKVASVKDVGQALRTQRQMKEGKKAVEASIRVGTERLDRLIDMVGELVIAHSMVAQDEIVNNGNHDLLKKVGHTSKIVREIQDMSMSMRMVPLKATFQKMTRLVRDLARNIGKNVNFVMEGEDTEIDRNMADAIKDPLVHMVRNAVDHGIEMPEIREKTGKPRDGLIKLSAYHSAGSVVVEIEDDGKGIDREVIINKALEKGLISDGNTLSDREVFNLLFEPGFSTAKTVTDVSGRGVGMDVVKKNIEALRGQTEIQSVPGKGSVFQMRLPLTLAIIDGMVARVGSETYVIPMLSIVMSIRPDPKDLSTVLNRGEMLSLQAKLIPLFRLTDLFHIEGGKRNPDETLVVVIEDDGNQAGLIIDELIGRQQVVIKTLGETMQNIPGISGSAIMPNGRVGLILDAGGVVKFANSGNGEGIEARP